MGRLRASDHFKRARFRVIKKAAASLSGIAMVKLVKACVFVVSKSSSTMEK